ncbi:unnamed protein product [Paramecium sonneborni]|uniref:Uncharacterized protein n=1 Tax=Paramecium sonneborni TaxID=65129 RepID=A0A8S1REU6_9CILI|nr:unnamed protein product [Paramecium sonneborni]
MQEQIFKIVIIGNSAVGKSSLLIRYCDDTFKDIYLSTIGVDFRFKTIKLDGLGVKLQIWDTAGQERFRNITNSYYKGAQGIVIVYDVTNAKSFEDVTKFWMMELSHYADQNVKLMLLGNKIDLATEETRQVSQEMAEQLAKEHNMQHHVVSAKTAEEVENAFISLARSIYNEKSLREMVHPQQQQLNNKKNKDEKQKTCC